MKKLLTTSLIMLTLISTSLYSPKADALVGYIFKKKIVKVMGGIGAIGGGVMSLTGYIAATSAGASAGTVISGAIFYAGGLAFGALGLIILDDNELADIEFTRIDLDNSDQYIGFSKEEVEIYNAELGLLNTIRQTIVSEVSTSDNTDEAEQLWMEYSENLSEATFEIAKAKAKIFVEAL